MSVVDAGRLLPRGPPRGLPRDRGPLRHRRAGRADHGDRAAHQGRRAGRGRRPGGRARPDGDAVHRGELPHLRADGARAATQRRLLQVGQQIEKMVAQREGETSAMLQDAETLVYGLSQKGVRGDFARAHELVIRGIERLTAAEESGTRPRPACATGFTDLDRIVGGLQPGQRDRRGRPAEHGQDGPRARHRRARGAHPGALGRHLQPRDERRRAHPAPARRRPPSWTPGASAPAGSRPRTGRASAARPTASRRRACSSTTRRASPSARCAARRGA